MFDEKPVTIKTIGAWAVQRQRFGALTMLSILWHRVVFFRCTVGFDEVVFPKVEGCNLVPRWAFEEVLIAMQSEPDPHLPPQSQKVKPSGEIDPHI